MESIRLPATANLLISTSNIIVKRNSSRKSNHEYCMARNFSCLASKGRGFGPEQKKEKVNTVKIPKGDTRVASESSKLLSGQPNTRAGETPGLSGTFDGKSRNVVSDHQFMERLEAVRRSALEQRKSEERKLTQAIDYDAPIKSDQNTIGLGTKVGVGIAVVVFGLVFALGDFLPVGSVNSDEVATVVERKLTEQEKETLERRLQEYEATLSASPNDLSALEGAAVTTAKLGDYNKASSLLGKLTKERPKDANAYRLLGEVEYELKDYESSVAAYRNSLSASEMINFEGLSGLTNALLAAKKPDEAVQVLLSTREDLNSNKLGSNVLMDTDVNRDKVQKVDPIQVDLLLGKAYSYWGHVGDAVAVYDQVISMHPNDFHGYLAKGIILKENGKVGDAERMFIQARFFAPEKVKALVDRYSR